MTEEKDYLFSSWKKKMEKQRIPKHLLGTAKTGQRTQTEQATASGKNAAQHLNLNTEKYTLKNSENYSCWPIILGEKNI